MALLPTLCAAQTAQEEGADIQGDVSGKVSWTLRECVDYALTNNISLKRDIVAVRSAEEDVKQARAGLFPSLSFGTSHSVGYRPWTNSNITSVTDGMVVNGADKGYYNGSYSLSANWTLWNGNKNHNQLKMNKMLRDEAQLDSAVTANSIQEQIAQYYVQALYLKEAVTVAAHSVEVSRANEQRGKVFVEVGSMSKADLAQLTAQRSQDEYALVEAQSELSLCLVRLKQVLELPPNIGFDVSDVEANDSQALELVPDLNEVFNNALEARPEIKRGLRAIERSQLQEKIARASFMPTIGVSAGAGSGTNSMNASGWSNQFKSNFDMQVGVTASVPIFDQRQARTAVNKARLQQVTAELELQDSKKSLYSTIENYWEQAVTSQQKFIAARENVSSREASFELLREQFDLGLKNVVELMTSKSNLLQAQQSMLQSKYTAILNIQMLRFYQRGQSNR